MAVSEETIYREHPCFGPHKHNKGRIHLPVARAVISSAVFVTER